MSIYLNKRNSYCVFCSRVRTLSQTLQPVQGAQVCSKNTGWHQVAFLKGAQPALWGHASLVHSASIMLLWVQHRKVYWVQGGAGRLEAPSRTPMKVLRHEALVCHSAKVQRGTGRSIDTSDSRKRTSCIAVNCINTDVACTLHSKLFALFLFM